MNRFVKHNMLLIAVFAVSGVAAVALMIYALIEYVQMAQQITKIDKLRSEIETIGKQTPRPVDENKPRLEADIKLYEKSAADLRSHFGRPMQPAVDAFIAALQPDRKPAAKKEGEDAPEEPEKLTEESFIAKFKEGWDPIPATQYAQQNYFIESKFRPNYPKWRLATAKFAELAQAHTFEKINNDNVDSILLNAMGISRRLEGRPEKLQMIFNEFREKVNEALEGKIDLTEQANRLGFPSDAAGTYARADYSILLDHMNIIYDMLRRLKAPKDPKDTKEPMLKIIHDIRIRNNAGNPDNGEAGAEGGMGGGDAAGKWGGSIENDGDYSSYHYTLVVSGPMEAIRDVAVKLANAYKDRRVYIVRSVFLYAEENRAAALFMPAEVAEPENNNAGGEQPVAQPTTSGRRRGRRGVQAAAIEQPAAQLSESDAAAKKKRDEAERLKAYQEKQKKLPLHERDGYGEILVGGDKDFRAVIDIDYVVLNR